MTRFMQFAHNELNYPRRTPGVEVASRTAGSRRRCSTLVGVSPTPARARAHRRLRVVRGLDCVDETPLLDLKPDRTLFTPLAPPQGGDFQIGDSS